MKSRCLILTASLIVFALFLQIGCQKQAVVSPAQPPPPSGPVKEKPPEPAKTPPPAQVKVEPVAPLTPPTAQPPKPQPAPQPEEKTPKITFENAVYDFGEVVQNSKNFGEFKFTNTGNAVLKIGKIYSSCGCTVPQLAKDEYAPGENGNIKVEYHPGMQAGQQSRRLDVPSNDKANPKVVLTVKALVVVKVDYEPKRLTLSFNKNDPNALRPKIKINSLDGQPFAINGFIARPDVMSLDYDPNVKNAEFIIEPKVDAEKLQKNLQGYIQLSITYPGYNSISIPFSVTPKFRVSPPAIVLLDAKPHEPVEREVTVLNNYGEPLEIESTSTQKNIIKVLDLEKAGDRCKVKVSITPPTREDNPKIFADMLFINIKDGPKLEVSCRGFYSSAKEGNKP